MRGHNATIKKFATYTSKEVLSLCVYGLVIGFILSFDNWGEGKAVDIGVGLYNLFYFVIISLLILFSTTYIQKIIGAHIGIIPKFQSATSSFLIPLLITLVSAGKIPFFLLPGFTTHEELSQMLGRNRYRRGFVDYLQIGAIGVLFMSGMGLLFSVPFFQELFPGLNTTFFLFAVWSLIPFDLILKPFDKNVGVSNGAGILFCSRSIFVFVGLFLLFAFILSKTTLFFISILLALLLAFIFAILYFLYEQNVFSND